ncbi:MAG TPA: metal-dependent hydrolase [Vicinamibacterales bacterium]|nr:metal-dependent hydrolase [Vicinamibacterales bacterium]
MPSPVGHGLAGLAAGWLVRGAPHSLVAGRPAWWRDALLYGLLGMLPDIDLLFGAHSGPTHGIGAALVAVAVAWAAGAAAGGASGERVRLALACGCAYGSHILLDWLGTDTSAPIGIMALWPLSRQYYDSGLHVFMAVSRRYWQGGVFWRQNLVALVRELLILVPLLAITARVRRR